MNVGMWAQAARRGAIRPQPRSPWRSGASRARIAALASCARIRAVAWVRQRENSTAAHSLYAAGYGCKQGEAGPRAGRALKSEF